eukprot:Em0001g2188a
MVPVLTIITFINFAVLTIIIYLFHLLLQWENTKFRTVRAARGITKKWRRMFGLLTPPLLPLQTHHDVVYLDVLDLDSGTQPQEGPVPEHLRCMTPNCSKPRCPNPGRGGYYDYCSKRCMQDNDQTFRFVILEAASPEYVTICEKFRKDWGKGHCPNIDYILKVCCDQSKKRWMNYKATLASKGSPTTVEQYYHGTIIKCNPVVTKKVCSHSDCGVCGISHKGFNKKLIGKIFQSSRGGSSYLTTTVRSAPVFRVFLESLQEMNVVEKLLPVFGGRGVGNKIFFYNRGEPYFEFTNFAEYPIKIDGKTWPTTEHYFQAQKFVGTPYEEVVRTANSAREAFSLSRQPQASQWLRKDWEQVKVGVMYKALVAKFSQHSKLRATLLGTEDRELVEHTKNDGFWGDGGDGSGQNQLGKQLMRVRYDIQQQQWSLVRFYFTALRTIELLLSSRWRKVLVVGLITLLVPSAIFFRYKWHGHFWSLGYLPHLNIHRLKNALQLAVLDVTNSVTITRNSESRVAVGQPGVWPEAGRPDCLA